MDVDPAVRNALDRRTDLQQTRKNLEATDINIRYFQNQTLPDVTASFDYGLTGLGGTQFLRGEGFPGPVIGQTQRSFGSVLGDLFGNQFPNWTASLNVSYPLGATQQEADLARARLQYTQSTTQLKNQQLQVVSEVREAARQVLTNQKRVETTRASRQLAERRLEAEQRKFTAGTSTSFFVFQAQRDLAQARNNELRAILDYNRSTVDLETVQEAPLTPLTGRGDVRFRSCRTCRSRSSRSTKRTTSRRRSTAPPGPTRSSSSTREHGRHAGPGARARASTLVDAALVGLRGSEELRGRTRAQRLDLLARCRRADPGRRWRRRFARSSRPSLPARGYRVPRVTFHLGRWMRTTDFYPDFQTQAVRPARGAVARPVRARVGVGGRRGGTAEKRAGALLLPRPAGSPRTHQPVLDAGGAADARGGTPRRTRST